MVQNEAANNWEIGDMVKMPNKQGLYAAEIIELSGPKALVKVMAVLKHPEQGDLHNPYNPDVPMFHERRALSYTEKTWVMVRDLERCHGQLPDYKESLQAAVDAELVQLDKLKRWSERGIEQLQRLKSEYSASKL